MRRDNFKQIIKLRSFWKIDKRKGNYRLPNGTKLDGYVRKLIEEQMELDKLAIAEDGNLYFRLNCVIMKPYGDNEVCNDEEQDKRIEKLVKEMIG